MCEIENKLIRKYSHINSYYSSKTKAYLNTTMDILAGETQTDVPVGSNTQTASATGSASGWQGMTIKDILDKVDLFNFTMLSDEDEEKLKAAKAQLEAPEPVEKKPKIFKSEPTSAFLGPKIWKKPITLNQLTGVMDEPMEANRSSVDSTGAEFSVMNINDFLAENNFDLGTVSSEDIFDEPQSRGQKDRSSIMRGNSYRNRHESTLSDNSEYSMDPQDGSTIGSPEPTQKLNKSRNALPKGNNSFLYAESKRARLEREKEERRQREEARMEFSAEELALATVPGADFDPSNRHFSLDELRPQPIIRKRKKSYVTFDKKDDKYWEKRNKNNVAARRSREARRLKENQISLRTAFLESENAQLKTAFEDARETLEKQTLEKKMLIEKLKRYESMSPFLNNAD